MKFWLLLLLALPAAAALAAGPGNNATGNNAAERKAQKQSELSEIQGRITDLGKDLARSEESRTSVSEQLRETESAISTANRRLRELADGRGQVQAELVELGDQQQRLNQQTASQQAQLGRLLRQQHRADMSGGASSGDAMQTLLAGRDPNQAARDWHLLNLLSRAKADLIRDLATAAAKKQLLAQAAEDKSRELARIEQSRQEERATLLARQRERQAVMAKIAGQIRNQRREIDTLKRDEGRLSTLIEGLAKLAAQRPKATTPPRPPPRSSRPSATAPASPPPREAETSRATGTFAALKGKLKLPIKGALAGRFGAPRPEGGSWKGIFIRAAEGTEVRAVAAGRVVFADWLRGFGNLLIIDHDDGFLSVYGNNQSLLRQAGEAARSGEVVAAAGNSGGNPESGLYFELRHQGQVFDPMKWINPR